MPIEMLRQNAKRVRCEEEEGSSSRYVHVSYGDDDVRLTVPRSETHATTQHQNASSSRPTPTSTSIPKQPPETPSHPTRQSEPTNARRSAAATTSPRSDTNVSASATKKPANLTPLQTRHDTLEILFSSPDRQAPPPTDGQPEPRSPPRHVKRIKVRLRTPSDIFASDPSSPKRDAAFAVGALIATSVYPRAPPRVVDLLHGQVLVDRGGHVRRALLHGEEDGAEEEEEEEDMARWPPARGRTAKARRVSGPNVDVDAHHAVSPNPSPGLGLLGRARQ
jgi:hypothetical protein